MKLSMLDADIRDKTKRAEEISRRAADLKTSKKAERTDWTISAFCEDDQHQHCAWQECTCVCHKFEHAYGGMGSC